MTELAIAVAPNPSFSLAHYTLASVRFLCGHHQDAAAGFDTAARLSPIGPRIWDIQTMHANTLAAWGQFDPAVRNRYF